jgi:transposase-like protein
MSADLTNPVFTNEEAAVAHLEASRWPDGAFCPHCGSFNVHRMKGKTQAGMFLCNDCRDKFTARVGSVMERSHVPVHKWLLAIHLLTSSKKGMSAHQLHRMLGVTYKTAWFMAHRIREAMRPEGSAVPPHFFMATQGLAAGLCVAHTDLRTAYDETTLQIKNLIEVNHSLDLDVVPGVEFGELQEWVASLSTPKNPHLKPWTEIPWLKAA